eukprot:6175188-Pyramimonas_sp.AAC.1
MGPYTSAPYIIQWGTLPALRIPASCCRRPGERQTQVWDLTPAPHISSSGGPYQLYVYQPAAAGAQESAKLKDGEDPERGEADQLAQAEGGKHWVGFCTRTRARRGLKGSIREATGCISEVKGRTDGCRRRAENVGLGSAPAHEYGGKLAG